MSQEIIMDFILSKKLEILRKALRGFANKKKNQIYV